MQVFINRVDLTLENPPVAAIYPELPIIPREAHGLQVAVLSLPSAAIQTDPDTAQQVLVGDWRTVYVTTVCNNEARRRIEESFPDYMQRNVLWAIQHNVTRYGADPTTWGITPQAEYATAEQAWGYVDTIRGVADVMVGNMPIDPTDDANWPPRLPFVYMAYE
jgi:hypothetical protein